VTDRHDQGRRCLVLGGRGYIGAHLVEALARAGYRVRSFDLPGSPLADRQGRHARIEVVDGDFTCEADLAEAVADCDICFHLVSTTLPETSNADPVFDVGSNLLATLRLLERAQRAGIRRIVFLSSGGTVYGHPREIPIPETHATDPLCSYGIVKLATEKYLELFRQLHGMDYVVLRVANPFGEGQRLKASQGAVAVFLGKALRDEPVEIWGDGSVVRDYVHISDVVAAILLAATCDSRGRVFNIGSGRGLSLNDVLDGIAQVVGRTPRRIYHAARPFDVPVNVLRIDRARDELGWRPTLSFIEGLERFARSLDEAGVTAPVADGTTPATVPRVSTSR
jgi:UDP-glucose 4-epimerase